MRAQGLWNPRQFDLGPEALRPFCVSAYRPSNNGDRKMRVILTIIAALLGAISFLSPIPLPRITRFNENHWAKRRYGKVIAGGSSGFTLRNALAGAGYAALVLAVVVGGSLAVAHLAGADLTGVALAMPGLITAKHLREQRMNLHTEYQGVLDRASGEGRELSSEDRQTLDRMDERDKELKADIERIEAHEARAAALAASGGAKANDARGAVTDPPSGEEERGGEGGPSADAVNAAFQQWVRYGEQGMTTEQRSIMRSRFNAFSQEERAQAAGSDAAGGFTVPDEPMRRIESAQLAYGGMRRAPTTQFQTATGAPLPIPTDNDTSNTGELLSENTSSNEQDITFGQAVLNAYMYSSKIVRVSIQLLQDSSVDLNQFVFDKLGVRLGRIQNTHFTTGDGASKPQGVVTGATLGVTGASASDITFDEVMDLIHSVDPDYRNPDVARFMMSDDTLKVVKKIKDGNGRPIWQPNVQLGEPDTIDRFGYVVNQDVADMASSAKSLLFGDWSKYHIRDVSGVMMLRLAERYAEYLQVGFIAFRRCDGLLVDAGTRPVKYFQNAA